MPDRKYLALSQGAWTSALRACRPNIFWFDPPTKSISTPEISGVTVTINNDNRKILLLFSQVEGIFTT